MKRDQRVHLHTVQEDLNHDEPGRLEDHGEALYDETEQIEAELAVGSEADTAGDHEDDHEQPLVHILDTEDPLDEENCDRVECLQNSSMSNVTVEAAARADGEQTCTLSIWMKETVRWR